MPRLPALLRRPGEVVRQAPIRYKLWKFVTPLNARHMRFAWISLFGVALCDLYVRLVASGTIHDPGFHF